VAILIVQHTAENAEPSLYRIISKYTSFKTKVAQHGETLEAGVIYTNPSNQHLLVKDEKIFLGDGMLENRSRPSINNLFRSAAVAYKQECIGILLTGLLYDGTKGLEAIKELGGVTIVQDPDDAEYDEMPANAIKNVKNDFIAAVEDMAAIIKSLVRKDIIYKDYKVTSELRKQIDVASKNKKEGDRYIEEDKTSTWEVDDSLYSILQMLQERSIMLANMAEAEKLKRNNYMAEIFLNRATDCRAHTENFKKHLNETVNNKYASKF
jgi:two-component system chemotaxis response regulator CheB